MTKSLSLATIVPQASPGGLLTARQKGKVVLFPSPSYISTSPFFVGYLIKLEFFAQVSSLPLNPNYTSNYKFCQLIGKYERIHFPRKSGGTRFRNQVIRKFSEGIEHLPNKK